MSIWNTSHSVGAFVAAVICGYLTSWQLCFWVPATISLFGILFIFATLRDTPKSVGLKELPKVEGELDDVSLFPFTCNAQAGGLAIHLHAIAVAP